MRQGCRRDYALARHKLAGLTGGGDHGFAPRESQFAPSYARGYHYVDQVMRETETETATETDREFCIVTSNHEKIDTATSARGSPRQEVRAGRARAGRRRWQRRQPMSGAGNTSVAAPCGEGRAAAGRGTSGKWWGGTRGGRAGRVKWADEWCGTRR